MGKSIHEKKELLPSDIFISTLVEEGYNGNFSINQEFIKIVQYDSFDYLVIFALFKTLQHFDKSENEIITIGHCYLHQLFIDLS